MNDLVRRGERGERREGGERLESQAWRRAGGTKWRGGRERVKGRHKGGRGLEVKKG